MLDLGASANAVDDTTHIRHMVGAIAHLIFEWKEN